MLTRHICITIQVVYCKQVFLSRSARHIAEQILGERLQQDESLPHLLCRPCVRRFKNLIEFKNVIVESQQTLAAECRSKRCKETSPSSMLAKTSNGNQQVGGNLCLTLTKIR